MAVVVIVVVVVFVVAGSVAVDNVPLGSVWLITRWRYQSLRHIVGDNLSTGGAHFEAR